MPLDVAQPVGNQGFSKQAAKEFIHENAVGSFGHMIEYMPFEQDGGVRESRVSDEWRWLEKLTHQQRQEITMNIMDSAENCHIVVVGADRAKTACFPSSDGPHTEGIDQYLP